MANYTILSNSVQNNRSTVVIEFPVPATSNTASVAWRDIVAELRAIEQGQPDSVATQNPRKDADVVYLALLDAGEVTELSLTVEYDAGLNLAGKVAAVDAAVTERVADYTTEFASLYQFYGTERTA